mmetsp:Transcript_4487/g.9106  ORF Transcript_4487/g.9106 Transcript_4487/m.9106 type:complete len:250 (+) Transcript_4487:184-933(+)
MGLLRTTSMANGIKTMSPNPTMAQNMWNVDLSVVRSQSCVSAREDAQETFPGLKMASLPNKSYSYQEILIIAILKLFDASHDLLSSDVRRNNSPLQKLLRRVCPSPKLEDLPSDSSTLEQMLLNAEKELELSGDDAAHLPDLGLLSQQGSERSLVSDEEGQMDLDALYHLDECYAVSETFGCPDSPSQRRPGAASSSLTAFSLIEDSWAEYDAHFSSSFVQKAGSLARNDACVDLAQLDALVGPDDSTQ